MAIFLSAKPPADVVLYTWKPTLEKGDEIAEFTLTPTGATIDAEEAINGEVQFYVSGGTAGATAAIAASVVTVDGEELSETIYLPIITSAAQIAHTAREYVNFALRKIIGNGETPSADELTDALERLNALVASWRALGADIGAPFPILAETVIYCPDWAVSPLRYNLLVECCELYGEQPTQMDVMRARQGAALVRNMNLPDDRMADYF